MPGSTPRLVPALVRQGGVGDLMPLFRWKVDDTVVADWRDNMAERDAHGVTQRRYKQTKSGNISNKSRN